MKDLAYDVTVGGTDTKGSHGRYFVKDTYIWFQKAIFSGTTPNFVFSKFADPVCIGLYPMNSSTILDSSQVIYGNVTQTDERIFQ